MTENQYTDVTENPELDSDQSKLSTFMKVSITILAVVTVLSISLLFIGDFAGRFERVFSTLALFAVFVLLTMFDTRRSRRNDWYAPLALIANTYILGLLLIVIWVTPYDPFTLQFEIFWQSLYVIVLTRLVVWGIELLFRRGEGKSLALTGWSQATGVLCLLTLVMFTAPLGFTAFGMYVPELYWKFAVAALILAGLGIAVTLLLSWYFRSQEKQAKRERAALAPEQPIVHSQVATQFGQHHSNEQYPNQPQEAQYPTQTQAHPAPQHPAPAPQQELLPWPTFADGTPLPMKEDGQPDFSVLGAARPPHGH